MKMGEENGGDVLVPVGTVGASLRKAEGGAITSVENVVSPPMLNRGAGAGPRRVELRRARAKRDNAECALVRIRCFLRGSER